jgi:hypothetical protein
MAARRIYPWDAWFARRRPVRLRRGEHYRCSTLSIAQAFRNEAAKRKASVSIEELDDGLRVTIECPR